ncbi:hypothetical protein HMPREF1155_0797 [Slackia sp. CM382]|nr:hypothetical protein HMPREF1155_0797 [Slackia sp. CM382]
MLGRVVLLGYDQFHDEPSDSCHARACTSCGGQGERRPRRSLKDCQDTRFSLRVEHCTHVGVGRNREGGPSGPPSASRSSAKRRNGRDG